MQQRLSLFGAAFRLTWRTVLSDLRDVTPYRTPAFDLALVIRTTTSHVVAAVPLKPTARICVIDPPFHFPVRERFRGTDAEIVQLPILSIRTQLRAEKPRRRELTGAVSHILAGEDAQHQHLAWRQFGFEFRMEVSSDRFS